MTKKIIFGLLAVPLLAGIFYINKKVDSAASAIGSPSSHRPEDQRPKQFERAADPKNYGIEESRNEDVSRSEEGWASAMSDTLSQPEFMEALNQQGILEDLKNNPQKINERLERVEEETKQQEIRVRQFPTNPDEKDRLQSLYMLKATLKALNQKADTATSPK